MSGRNNLPTEKDRRLLNSLRQYYIDHGYHASIREVCQMAGTPSTSVGNYYLERLERLGLIERTPKVSRGIRIIEQVPISKPETATVQPVKIVFRSPKQRVSLLQSVTVLGCKMRRFTPWPNVKPLTA